MTDGAAILLLKDQIKLFENGKDRTAEKALVYLENYIEALNMAIEALNTRDSLEKKVEYLTNELEEQNWSYEQGYKAGRIQGAADGYDEGWRKGFNDQQPKSKWICVLKSTFPQSDEYKCPECGYETTHEYRYCPDCGKKLIDDDYRRYPGWDRVENIRGDKE